MKTLRIICRIFIGLVFVFSGYTKAIDPMGSHIIFSEYFKAFHLTAIMPVFLPLVVWGAPLAEMLIGFCALMGVRMKETSWLTVLFMGFFTVLTFILAVFNPVTDCGCFGEAIKLTNWETFIKNLIILPFAGVMFWQRKRYRTFASRRVEWATVGTLTVLIAALSVYCYRHLPLVDFMAYKVGANIPEVMQDSKPDTYDTFLYYEKDGVTREFTLNNYPDSTWKYVDRKDVLKEKGYESPMIDFAIATPAGDYITDSVLNLPGYVFLLTLPHAEDASVAQGQRINALAEYCAVNDSLHFFALTGSVDEQVIQFAAQTGAMAYSFYNTDEKPLMSMVRSNPGLLVLRNATILAKWSRYDLPSPEELQGTLLNEHPDEIIARHRSCERYTTGLLTLLALAGMVVWGFVCRKTGNRRKSPHEPAA